MGLRRRIFGRFQCAFCGEPKLRSDFVRAFEAEKPAYPCRACLSIRYPCEECSREHQASEFPSDYFEGKLDRRLCPACVARANSESAHEEQIAKYEKRLQRAREKLSSTELSALQELIAEQDAKQEQLREEREEAAHGYAMALIELAQVENEIDQQRALGIKYENLRELRQQRDEARSAEREASKIYREAKKAEVWGPREHRAEIEHGGKEGLREFREAFKRERPVRLAQAKAERERTQAELQSRVGPKRDYTRSDSPASQLDEEPSPEDTPTLGLPHLTDRVRLGLNPDGAHISLPNDVRSRHVYVIGRTGSGKSTLLRHVATQDMLAGHGLCIIDPHGDLVDDLAGYAPLERIERGDIIYFDPLDDHSPAFNLLTMPFEPAKLVADVVSTFKMFFGESSFGPRMEHLMRHALLLLILDREPHSIADLRRLLRNEDYCAELVERCSDQDLAEFWTDEYPNMSKDAGAPILNKIGTVLVTGSPLQRIFSARENALDFTDIMDNGKVLLVRLSKGLLGEDPAKLLGGMITTAIAQTALARASIPEHERRPFYFYCDEFQNFAAIPSVESILSEARKYALRLTLAHQTLKQVPPKLLASILGNVQTMISFGISADDAGTIKKEMGQTRQRSVPLTDEQKRRHREQVSSYNLAVERLKERAHDRVYAQFSRNSSAGDMAAYRESGKFDAAVQAEIDRNALTPPTEPDERTENYFWPDVSDFVNLDTCHAFVRIGKPIDTKPLHVPFPQDCPDIFPTPKPDAALVDEIKRRQREQPTHSPLEQPAPAHQEEASEPFREPQSVPEATNEATEPRLEDDPAKNEAASPPPGSVLASSPARKRRPKF